MIRRTSYVAKKYDRSKSLERQNSVKESLDALGISLDDDDDLFVVRRVPLSPPLMQKSYRGIVSEQEGAQAQNKHIILTKDHKRKCPPRRVSVDEEAATPEQTPISHTTHQKTDGNREPKNTPQGQKRASRQPKKKIQELHSNSSFVSPNPSPTKKSSSNKPKEKSSNLEEDSRSITSLGTDTSESINDSTVISSVTTSRGIKQRNSRRRKRASRKPKKKSQELKDDNSSTTSLATDTSESVNDFLLTPEAGTNNENETKSSMRKRSSFLVPTIDPQSPIPRGGLNDSMRIDELYLPGPISDGRSSVTFSDFSEMTIVADLYDDNDDLFYKDEELADFRHEAFLESCGLGEEFMHL